MEEVIFNEKGVKEKRERDSRTYPWIDARCARLRERENEIKRKIIAFIFIYFSSTERETIKVCVQNVSFL